MGNAMLELLLINWMNFSLAQLGEHVFEQQ